MVVCCNRSILPPTAVQVKALPTASCHCEALGAGSAAAGVGSSTHDAVNEAEAERHGVDIPARVLKDFPAEEKGRNLAKLMEIDLSEQRLALQEGCGHHAPGCSTSLVALVESAVVIVEALLRQRRRDNRIS